jgi:4'-phosphopantetheinyl transferase EntD
MSTTDHQFRTDATIEASIASELAVPGILIEHRLIRNGDEQKLLSQELICLQDSSLEVRRASGAARIVARELMARLGKAACAIPKAASGFPIWPKELVGSIAHDREIAIVALAKANEIVSLGVDIEPPDAMHIELSEMVATNAERRQIGFNPLLTGLLFTAKEAVYKAVYPLDMIFLNFLDIEIDLTARRAIVRNGRILELRFCNSPRLVTVAYLPRQ